MSFTRRQQGKYRPLVESAWQRHAAEKSLDPKSAAERRSWYERELRHCVGFASTVPCDNTRDFDALMAHFEALADDGSTYWQQRLVQSDMRRIHYTVFGNRPPFAIDGRTIDESYCLGIAEQMKQEKIPGGLSTLRKDDITAIIQRLLIHRNRHGSAN